MVFHPLHCPTWSGPPCSPLSSPPAPTRPPCGSSVAPRGPQNKTPSPDHSPAVYNPLLPPLRSATNYFSSDQPSLATSASCRFPGRTPASGPLHLPFPATPPPDICLISSLSSFRCPSKCHFSRKAFPACSLIFVLLPSIASSVRVYQLGTFSCFRLSWFPVPARGTGASGEIALGHR